MSSDDGLCSPWRNQSLRRGWRESAIISVYILRLLSWSWRSVPCVEENPEMHSCLSSAEGGYISLKAILWWLKGLLETGSRVYRDSNQREKLLEEREENENGLPLKYSALCEIISEKLLEAVAERERSSLQRRRNYICQKKHVCLMAI